MLKEVGTSIVNLDRLNSISNVDTFEFADGMTTYIHGGISKRN